jgi:hypothetical protein
MLGMRFGTDPRWCSDRQALTRVWQVQRGESGTRIYSYKRIERGARLKDHEREGKGRGVNVAPSSRCYRSTPYFMQARSTASPSTWTSPTSIPLLPNMCLRFVGDFSVVLPSLMRKGLVHELAAIKPEKIPTRFFSLLLR